VELERPLTLDLDRAAEQLSEVVNDRSWTMACAARATPLLQGPVAHFLVTGFVSQGVDQVLAHLLIIEAALGSAYDYGKGTPPRSIVRPKVRNAGRLKRRVAGLLQSEDAATIFDRLFQLRSDYLHGRQTRPISSSERNQARSLARRTATALIDLAEACPTTAREDLMDQILEAGFSLTERTSPSGVKQPELR